MAKKKKAGKAKADTSEKTIQYVASGWKLTVVGIFAWQYMPKPKSTVKVGSGTACEPFASMAAAEQYNSAAHEG